MLQGNVRLASGFGMMIRENKWQVSWLNPMTGSTEIVAESPLPQGQTWEQCISDPAAFSTVFHQAGQILMQKGVSQPQYILCIPDGFSMGDRIRIHEMADQAGIELIRMIPESEASAIYACRRYQTEGLYLLTRIDSDQLICSMFDYSDGVLEKTEKSTASLERGLYAALKDCIRQFSGMAFTRSFGLREERFTAPALVIMLGSDMENREMETHLRSSLDGLNGSERIRFYSGSPGDIALHGVGIYAAVLAGTLREFLFLDATGPNHLYVQGLEKIQRVGRNRTVPCEERLSALDGMEKQGTVTVLEEDEKGLLHAVAAYDVQKVEDEAQNDFRLTIDEDLRLSLAAVGWKTQTADHICRTEDEPQDIPESVLRFLEIADSLEYGMQGIHDPDDPHLLGLNNLFRKITDTFSSFGIERYGNMGEKFDPNMHNAVVHVTDIDLPENCIQQVIQSGYRTSRRIVRYASVIVAN